jgi:hypothetical protein
MPKDRKMTYSDRQAQASRDKKMADKKATREDAKPVAAQAVKQTNNRQKP